MPRPVNDGSSRPLVLHVIYHLVIGGMENGLVNLINRMDATRWRHAIACVEDFSDFRQRIARPDVEVFALRRSQIGVWGLRRRLYELCNRMRPAIVHSRNQSGLDALPSARLAGVPHTVHGEHGWDVGDLNGLRFKPALLRRLHSPLVSRYVTVSKGLQNYLVERVGVSPQRIERICNGVDVDRFGPAGAPRDEILPQGFAGAGDIVIGTLGRAQPVKDQAALLRAFAQVRQTHVDLTKRMRLMLVGDGPLLAALRDQAQALGISEVTWFAGAQRDVGPMLRAMDMFVLPSLNEGISNSILEAMACGVPVLATKTGGNPELVEDGVTGALFPPGDVERLGALLAHYCSDRTLRESHGNAGRARAEREFSLSAMTQRYAALYETLLASKPRRR